MANAQFPGRSISFPPRVDQTGRIAISDGVQNVDESIMLILLTNPGERQGRPAFGAGLRTFLFGANSASNRLLIQERIMQALTRWEPRISLTDVTVDADPDDQQSVIATVRYQIRPSGVEQRLAVRLPAGGDRGN
ncbi:MAG: phage tail protein [Symbiobacteriaceae bacterium]|nr:phage tail protein [Symbiobacteriaceae bacterium]